MMRCLGLLSPCLLAASVTPAAWAQYQTFAITPSVSVIPAGAYGTSLSGVLPSYTSTARNFNVCFYTGFGSLQPIVPKSFTAASSGASITFSVPASTIQEVPPESFVSGSSFNALLYTVPTTVTACTGIEQALGNETTITLNYPSLKSISFASMPQRNPNLSVLLPSKLTLLGTNFLSRTGPSTTSPSTVTFTSSDTVEGAVSFVSPHSLVSTIPTDIPADATSVSVAVCNTAKYSYCSVSQPLVLAPLQQASGSVKATPNPATSAQQTVVTATFGLAMPSVAGAPSGLVTFVDGGTNLGAAPLVLDNKAKLKSVLPKSFTLRTGPLKPIVADFNGDGIPDVLFVEPGRPSGLANGSPSIVHLSLGMPPSGDFAPDVIFTDFSKLPCATIVSAAAADFNQDGYTDLALLCNNSLTEVPSEVLYTLMSKGDGSFRIRNNPKAPVYGSRLLAGDFDKDGKPDLAAIGKLNADGDAGIQLLIGDGEGDFSLGPSTKGLTTDSGASATQTYYDAAVADFNGDGYPDVAVMNALTSAGSATGYVAFFKNDGNGGFVAASGTVPAPVDGHPQLLIAPLERTKLPSVVIALTGSEPFSLQTSINRGTPDIAFGPPVATPVSGLLMAATGDFNGDGVLDLAVAENADNMEYVLTGNGEGNFKRIDSDMKTALAAPAPNFFQTADENGDGYADLLVGSMSTAPSGIGVQNVRTFLATGSAVASLSPQTFAPGTHTITAATPGNYQILAGGAQTTLTVAAPKATPAIVWKPSPASIVYGTPLSAAQLDAASTTPGTFTYAPAAGTILAAGVQKLAVLFTPVDTATYKTVTVTATIVVTPFVPVLSWAVPASVPAGTALGAAQLNATAADYRGMALPGAFAYMPPAGTVLNTVGANTLGVLFTPADTSDYTTATATVPIAVTLAATSVSLASSLNPATSNQPFTLIAKVVLSSTQTVVTGSVGFYTGSTLVSTVPLNGNTAQYTPATLPNGTYVYRAIYSGDARNAASSSLPLAEVVEAVTPTIAWSPNPATITYGTPLSAGQLDATASVPGTFSYTPAIGSVLAAGTQTLSVLFTPTDTTGYKSVTRTVNLLVTPATPAIAWIPGQAAITYGTPLSGAQLDATSRVPGVFTYMPSLGTVLSAGFQTLSVLFTPNDSVNYKSVTGSASITVAQAVPDIVWPAPAAIAAGTGLSDTQLDATATGVDGGPLSGTFAYTPPADTVLPLGPHMLSVLFTPTDQVDYTPASASVSIRVITVALATVSPQTALLGDDDTIITLTGFGFRSAAVVQMNGLPVQTTFINSRTLTAVVPSADFSLVQTLQVSVLEEAQGLTSNSLPFTVTAPGASIAFTGAASVTPDSQPLYNFKIDPYPVPLTGNFTLGFSPSACLPDDPTVVFSNDLRTFSVTVPRNTTDLPVQFQSGTVAGTLTLTLALEAGGTIVTPASVQPLVIQAPTAVPGITSVTLTRNGDQLTVATRGYSNTRFMTLAKFHFVPAPGKTLLTTDLTVDVAPIFTAWYASSESTHYGSQFTYTQTFNLSTDAEAVGQATVTLFNDIGASPEATTP